MSKYVMSPAKIRRDYFEYLCEKVGIGTVNPSYFCLARDLHATPFTWTVPNDDNRAVDGEQLRLDFRYDCHRNEHIRLPDGPCSIFEMLIALAKRIDFALSTPDDDRDHTARYFWEMIHNIGLISYNDDDYAELYGKENVRGILEAFLTRDYCSNGEGGLFPLRYRVGDQREMELWYQMNAYIAERYKV